MSISIFTCSYLQIFMGLSSSHYSTSDEDNVTIDSLENHEIGAPLIINMYPSVFFLSLLSHHQSELEYTSKIFCHVLKKTTHRSKFPFTYRNIRKPQMIHKVNHQPHSICYVTASSLESCKLNIVIFYF